MAIILSTNTLSNVVRNTNFTETVNVTVDGTPPEVISSIEVSSDVSIINIMTEDGDTITAENTNSFTTETVPASNATDGVSISTTNSSITFSGSYESAFDADVIKSIPNGESDLITTPTVSSSFANVPAGHFIFSAIQDNRATVTVYYEVTIVYNTGTHTDTIIHTIDTDITTFANKLAELYPPEE